MADHPPRLLPVPARVSSLVARKGGGRGAPAGLRKDTDLPRFDAFPQLGLFNVFKVVVVCARRTNSSVSHVLQSVLAEQVGVMLHTSAATLRGDAG
jgi:hypothetical protein